MNKVDGKKEARKYCVLGHIIDSYVSTAVPVSSKIVADTMGGQVSSATVRNIMAELERAGYIEQPHTSAGRIPTHFGYRRYVDAIKNHIHFKRERAQRLAAEYDRRVRTIKEVIEKTSFLISHELESAGIVMWPNISDTYLKHIELIKIKAESVLAVLVTMTNAVKNYVIKLDRELDKAELGKISNFINCNFEQSPFSHIAEELRQLVSNATEDMNPDVIGIAEAAIKVMESVAEENVEDEIYWEGLNYFMEKDVDVSRKVLQAFSEKRKIASFMRQELPCRDIRIYIGRENNYENLKECSVITCGYTLHGRTAGRIGVIGSTRMNYERAIGTVSYLSDLISAKLIEING